MPKVINDFIPGDLEFQMFVLDELADLPRVENLARLLPEGRKFGAAIVLTFQALGQMRKRYGANIAEAMLALVLMDHLLRHRALGVDISNGPNIPSSVKDPFES